MDISKKDVEAVAKGFQDFWYFVTEMLGHKKCEDLEWEDLTKEHKELCEFLQGDETRFKLILMPRYSFKSCICTIGYALWRIMKNPNIRILIYSDNASKAQGFLSGLKNHILGRSTNCRFRELLGEWESDPQFGKWNDSQIIVSPRNSAEKEPTVDTSGIETSKIGMHYDLILFDDIVSDLNITTKQQMDKVYDCYRKSLSLLKPSGEVIMTGTRWSFGDTYGRIIAENQGEWGVFVKKIEVDGVYPFRSIGLDEDFLEKQRKRQGSYWISCLYYNEPVDASTALFRADNFNFYEDVDFRNLSITCCCDPAGEGDDFTAFTVVGTDKNMRMYLLHAKHAKYKPHQIVNEIIRLSYAYKFERFGVETNLFHGMLDKELQMRIAEERDNPNFKLFGTEVFRSTAKAGSGKHARILSLQPYHERGDLLFQGKCVDGLVGSYAELASQMLQYTEDHRPTHDDLIDCLSFHVKMMRRGMVEAEELPGQDSIAWVLEGERKAYNRIQRMLPRGHRRFQQKFI